MPHSSKSTETATKTLAYDVAEQLRTPEEMAAYLDAWLEEAADDVSGIARALGMEVAAWNSHVPPEHFERSGATPVDDLNKLIETSDVISVHLPLNNATRGIVTAENLAHVKPGTLFINTARSEVIESGALLARLQKGDVPAALDVFDHEPLTADDAICHVPGIVLTPHVGWRADGAFKELTRQMIACLTAYFAGEDYNVVVSER